jgi:hypothetical protein
MGVKPFLDFKSKPKLKNISEQDLEKYIWT